MPTRAEISAPLPTCVEDAAWNAWESLSGYSTRERVRAAVRAGLGVVAGNVEHHVSPVIGWVRSGSVDTDDSRRAVVEHLADALWAVQPGRDVPTSIQPGDVAGMASALNITTETAQLIVQDRQRAAVIQTLHLIAADPVSGWAIGGWLQKVADHVDAGLDPAAAIDAANEGQQRTPVEDLPEITLPPTVQTWMPGSPVIPGARWDWETHRWVTVEPDATEDHR